MFFQGIAEIITQAHQQAVNRAIMQSYWQIGRFIVEHEQTQNTQETYENSSDDEVGK